MIEVLLDHVDVMRGLLDDGTELVVKTLKDHITITYCNQQSKPIQTITIIRSSIK
jgi:hypothetical protein